MIGLIIGLVLGAGVVVLCAVMLSSQISQEEEDRGRKTDSIQQ